MTVVTSGLIAEFVGLIAKNGTAPGNNSDPTSVWDDTSPVANDLTLSNLSWTDTSGWDGDGSAGDPYSVATDADSSGVTSTSSSYDLAVDTAVTTEAWLYVPTAPTANKSILSVPADGRRGFCMYLRSTGTLGFQRNNDATHYRYTSSGEAAVTSGWHHFVCAYDGAGALRQYIDNALTDVTIGVSGTTTTHMTDPALTFAYATGGPGYLGASYRVATIRIYNRALSTGEVDQNYAAGILASTVVGENGFTGLTVYKNLSGTG